MKEQKEPIMSLLKDSSEMDETLMLFDELIDQAAISKPDPASKVRTKRIPETRPKSNIAPFADSSFLPVSQEKKRTPDEELDRGDQLEITVESMCKRGGFSSAVVTDSDGLLLAVYNTPVDDDALTAFTVVMGDALEKAGTLLNQREANYISIDMNYTDKAVLRRFFINDIPFYMMIICPQRVDEKAEVELSIEQITSLLKQT
jgi:hypothetical protein